MKIALKMTGCKNNRYELEEILRWAITNKVPVVSEEEADYCVINTCTVTSIADRKSRQMVRSTKKTNPKLKTIIFGCAAKMQKEGFKKMGEADFVFGALPEVIGFLNTRRRRYISSPAGLRPTDYPKRARALTQIQDGCDNFCTYCLIAPARGRSVSRPTDKIIAEIRQHEKDGYNEVMLTGINIGAYGCTSTTKADESKLAELLRQILDQTTMPRIRLSSLGPQYFSGKLFEVIKNPRVCRHIHLSIQSGSDEVLERMKRYYTVADVEAVIGRLKKEIPGIAITTDIIVGFPEETDKEFQETFDFVKRNQLAKVHVFPYSIRPGTLAATMKQVLDNVKKDRAKLLQQLSDELRCEFLKSQIGKTVSVLWRKEVRPGVMEGLTDNYIRVTKKTDAKRRSLSEEKLTKENMVWE